MSTSWNLVIFFLLWSYPLVSSKGIILYGKGKVVSNKKSTPASTSDEQDEASDKFQFALFTPTAKAAKESESFRLFTKQGISARVAGQGSRRTYYFMQDARNYETRWMADPNVCQIETRAWQLKPNGGFLFENSEQRVTVYFLCDQYCCGSQCCDLNVIFLVCMIFFIMFGLSITIWLSCRYGRRYCRRTKEFDEDEFVDAEEYLQIQTTDVQKSNSPRECLRSQSVPLKTYNGDDVRL